MQLTIAFFAEKYQICVSANETLKKIKYRLKMSLCRIMVVGGVKAYQADDP